MTERKEDNSMFKKIVVLLDGSPLAEKALPYAAQFARIFGSEIILLRGAVGQVYWGDLPPVDAEQALREASDYLKLVQTLLTDPLLAPSLPIGKVTIRVVDSDAPVALAETAREIGGDLIIMTTHAYGDIARLFMGSVAMGVLHATTLPVILLHPQDVAFDYTYEANLTNILVTLDGTIGAEAILDTVAGIAKTSGATLTLLRVVAPFNPPQADIFTPRPYYPPELVAQETGEQETEARNYLVRVQAELKQKGVQSQIVVKIGATGDTILDYLAETKPQLMAMATHARNYLGRMVLGSVADEIVRQSYLPVLMVHRQKQIEQPAETKVMALEV
jgi:nucleotide-binding universal stress UspA family protein